MKITKIIASTIILFALNVNSFATDTSDKLLNSIESNKQNIASALIKNGRNKNRRTNQESIVLQFSDIHNNEVALKVIQPKGRNLEALDGIEIEGSSYAKAGRNNKTINEMISMY